MQRRIWIPTQSSAAPPTQKSHSTITFYDAGKYWGQLVNDEVWICYRVIKREKLGDEIHEELERMEDDYIPWSVASIETYILEDVDKDSGNITIPGWRLIFA
jgi:hypothetical protein